jgi:hypothetical protein
MPARADNNQNALETTRRCFCGSGRGPGNSKRGFAATPDDIIVGGAPPRCVSTSDPGTNARRLCGEDTEKGKGDLALSLDSFIL